MKSAIPQPKPPKEAVSLTARPPSGRTDCYLAIFKRERVR